MPVSRPFLVAVGAVATLLTSPILAAGQGAPLTVEARVGASVPVSTMKDGPATGEGTSAGAVFGVELTLASAGRRTLYTGFSQARFGCQDAGCPAGERYVATGVNAGFRFSLLRDRPVLPWLSLGVLTTRVESPGVTGSPEGVSELGYGVEMGAGLYVRTGGTLAFTPAIRYTRASTDLPGGASLALRYVAVDLGLVLAF